MGEGEQRGVRSKADRQLKRRNDEMKRKILIGN
jgi:hypothetical protein